MKNPFKYIQTSATNCSYANKIQLFAIVNCNHIHSDQMRWKQESGQHCTQEKGQEKTRTGSNTKKGGGRHYQNKIQSDKTANCAQVYRTWI